MVWFVSTSGSDSNDGQTPATAFLTPTHAASVATAGDTISLGSMFDLGTTGSFAPAAGVNVFGNGPGSGITGENCISYLGGNGLLVIISGTSVFENFSIVGNAVAGQYQFPLSVAAGAKATIRSVPITGQTDCIYFNSVVNANLTVYDCPLSTNWDAVFLESATGSSISLFDSPILSVGPATVSTTYYSTGIGIDNSTGASVRFYNSSIFATGNTTNQNAVHADAGTAYLYDASIQTSGSGTLTDLFQHSSGAIVVSNTAYSPAKTTGTITIANTPINQPGQIATGAIATGQAFSNSTANPATDGSGNPLATAAAVANVLTSVNNQINLSSLANLRGPSLLVIPTTASEIYLYTLTINNSEGQLVDLTGVPTVTAYNASGTDRSSNLSAVTHVSTGTYTLTYTVTAGDAEESLTVQASGTATGDSTARVAYSTGTISATDTASTIDAIQTTLDGIASGSTTIAADLQTVLGTRPLATSGVLWTLTNTGDPGANQSTLTAIGNALTAIATAIAAVPAGVWNVLQSAIATGATMGRWLLSITGGGTGAYAITLNLQDSVTAANIIGSRVGVSGQSAQGITDANGNVILAMNAGTVTIAVTADGYNGLAFGYVVSGNATVSRTMVAIPAPVIPLDGQILVAGKTVDQQGNAAPNATVYFRIVDDPNTFPATSDGSGNLSVTLTQSTPYAWRTATESSNYFTTTAGESQSLGNMQGTWT